MCPEEEDGKRGDQRRSAVPTDHKKRRGKSKKPRHQARFCSRFNLPLLFSTPPLEEKKARIRSSYAEKGTKADATAPLALERDEGIEKNKGSNLKMTKILATDKFKGF